MVKIEPGEKAPAERGFTDRVDTDTGAVVLLALLAGSAGNTAAKPKSHTDIAPAAARGTLLGGKVLVS